MHFLCICRFQREILYPELHLRLHLFAQSKTRACARALDSFPRSWRKFCAEPPLRDAVLRVSIKQEKPPMPSFGFPPEAEEGSCVLRFACCWHLVKALQLLWSPRRLSTGPRFLLRKWCLFHQISVTTPFHMAWHRAFTSRGESIPLQPYTFDR